MIINIDKVVLFKKAHRNAKKVTKENPAINYHAQLSIALKFLYEEARIKKVTKEVQKFYGESLTFIEKATLKEVNSYVSVIEATRKEFKRFKPKMVKFENETMLLNLFNNLDLEISDRIEEIKKDLNYYWINRNNLELIRDLDLNIVDIQTVTLNVTRALYMLGLEMEINFGIYYLDNKIVGDSIIDVYTEIKKQIA